MASAEEEDDPFSLDFTQTADKPVPCSPSSSAAKPLELTLEPLEKPIVPAPEQEEMDGVQQSVVPVFPRVHLEPAAEQAVLHYAHGEVQAARQTLENAMQMATSSEDLWHLLFDLYRRSQNQESFEQLALQFAKRFEKSPPPWQMPVELTAPAMTQQATANRATVALTGVLSARSAPQFAKLLEVAQTRSQLRLDLTRLQAVDEGGCQLLLDLISKLKMTVCTLQFDGIAMALPHLENNSQLGQVQHASIWLLRLDFLQRLGRLDEFEALALDYAITFEVSPPSWVEASIDKAVPEDDLAKSVQHQPMHETGLQYHGELLALTPDNFANLVTACRQADENGVTVDLSGVERIDLPSAQALYDALQTLTGLTGRIRWQGCSALLAGILKMAGVAELTQLNG